MSGKLKVATRFHPSEMIIEELEARKWTKSKLIDRMIKGTDMSTIQKLIAGKGSVTPVLAAMLSQAFGVSQEFFLNLQKAYDENDPNPRR